MLFGKGRRAYQSGYKRARRHCKFNFLFSREASKEIGMTNVDRWQIFFKLFCFIKPEAVSHESMEAAFMYEQVRIIALSIH